MNGIIHNCVRTLPTNRGAQGGRFSTSVPPATKSHQQIFLDVFKYIDNLLTFVTPRRVLYMAIDGVAPRAKMNQQRARRFRSAKERLDDHNRRTEEDPMYAAADIEPFDSNCITPGTHFMHKLTEALKYFVTRKLTEDVRWADLDVILSGAESPGEGEHKIMAYIRSMRESSQLPANTRHCVYGLDADLIMLGLVTHEPHFFVLREKVDFSFGTKRGGPRVATALDTIVFGDFELLSIGLLREYLILDLGADGNCALPYFDIERTIDDLVFIIMLIGNDFLPSLPTLDIADGTLHVMLHLYKRILPRLGGYLTNMGRIDGNRLEFFLAKLSVLEEDVLRQRQASESSRSGRRNKRGGREKTFANVDLDNLFGLTSTASRYKPFTPEVLLVEAARCREETKRIEPLKHEYYQEKFKSGFGEHTQDSDLQRITRAYIEGLAWTLRYYTHGCIQWRWFYPEHYAPLASDVNGVAEALTRYEESLESDEPFRPFEQLMSVLPPVSSWCLPAPYRMLMRSPNSPIRDQYPENFRVDLNGKRNDWEAVVLLPFVDERKLMAALSTIPIDSLTSEEIVRNKLGSSYLYRRDINSRAVMESPFETGMPSFVSFARQDDLVLPALAQDQGFTAASLPGTKYPDSNGELADLPTFKKFEHKGRLEAVSVNVFGTPSKSDSLLLVINFDQKGQTAATSKSNVRDAPILEKKGITVGSAVWCGYPWRAAAVVESISDELFTKRAMTSTGKSQLGEPVQIETVKTNKDSYLRNISVVTSSLLQTQAVSVTPPKQIVSVRLFRESSSVGLTNGKNGVKLHHEYFLTLRSQNDGGYGSRSASQLLEQRSVLYVGPGCYFGQKGFVQSHRTNRLRLKFETSSVAAKEPAFGYRVVSICGSQERWMSLSKLASAISRKVVVADQFLGSLRVRLGSGKDEVDLGLGVKYIKRSLYVPGYARPDERSHFLFSKKCMALLKEYSTKFPDLFAAVERLRASESRSEGRTSGARVFDGKELFPSLKKPDKVIKAVSTWLSAQDVASLPLVSSSADVLSREVVMELEKHCKIVLALQREYDEVQTKPSRGASLKDTDQEYVFTGHEPLEWDKESEAATSDIRRFSSVANTSDLRLGDRVVNRMGAGGVPFGLRGTVVGIHPHEASDDATGKDVVQENTGAQGLVEVCFDEGFIGGGNLSNRCSQGRGKVVPAGSLIISRPDRDNSFYVKNYARVAARVGLAPKGSSEEDESSSKRTHAVAQAATKSYAAAVKNASVLSGTSAVTLDSTDGGSELPRALSRGYASRSDGSHTTSAKQEIVQLAKPEDLPLPSFLKSQPPFHGGSMSLPSFLDSRLSSHTSRSCRTRQTAGPTRLSSRGEYQSQMVEGMTRMNGQRKTDVTQIEEELREALEQEHFTDESLKDVASRFGDQTRKDQHYNHVGRNDVVDEDEFANVWRKLQVTSETRKEG